MSQKPLPDSETAGDAGYRHRLNVEIPKIKILLYADDPDDVTLSTAPENTLSLGLMHAHLMAHQPASARFCLTYECRYRPGSSRVVNRINDVLDSQSKDQPFDQIWFFGLHLSNLNGPSFGLFEGGPDNEINEDEQRALLRWMEANAETGFSGVGVLMTGDHSNPRSDNAAPGTNPLCPDPAGEARLLGLGRALGRCVPRAGLLRGWEGSPTNYPDDSHNTVERTGNESDARPQCLILRNVNEAGEPDPDGQPHPLFYYKPGRMINVFPDHDHEGVIRIPESFPTGVWPPALRQGESQPIPHVVAYGINQRTSERIDLVAAYHGDRAGVGRVVADSTWHHYFNMNLYGFPFPAPEGSAADQIGQFYANLAVWLAPRSKRREMACAIFWQLAKYTMRLERRPGDPEPELSTGPPAYNLLSQIASPCEVHELLQAVTPEVFGTLKFAEGVRTLSHLPSRELLLGSIMCSYHDEMIRADKQDEAYRPLAVDEVIANGFMRALKKQSEILRQQADKAEDALRLFGQ